MYARQSSIDASRNMKTAFSVTMTTVTTNFLRATIMSDQAGPSNTEILTHIVAPVLFVYLVSHKVTRKYALYLFIAVFGLYYGYFIILKPTFSLILTVLRWLLLIPIWATYLLRWIYWKIIWGIQALAWFGFYVHFAGYGMKFILETIEKVILWIDGILQDMKESGSGRRG